MWKLLLFSAIAQVAHGACPTGFELIGNECRGTYAKTLLGVRNVTEITSSMCGGILGQPVIIHNEEDQAYWAKRAYPPVVNNGDLMLVLGLVCNSSTKKYEWLDGSPLDYKPKSYNYVLDKFPCTDDRFFINRDGLWNDWSGNTFTVDVSCTTKLNQPVPSGNGCDSFENDSEDGVCYQVFETAENREDAQKICKKFGANLATIHNSQENSFIRRLAVSKGAINGLFLGATISEDGNNFGWVDESESDYENFYPGFPIAGLGNCVAMDTSKSAGQWMNIDCSTKLPVACIREQKEVTEPTCNGGLSTEGTLITSPGFPYNATTPCDYFFQVNPQQRVEVEISLEANPCCDFLVIHDGFLGGSLIANITGEQRNATFYSKTNLMRVSWEPNSGENVRGLAISFASEVLLGSVVPELVCPPKYFFIEGRCIRPYTLNMNDYLDIIMEYAQAACEVDGAHLPIIRSAEENDMFNRIAQTFLEPSGITIYLVLGMVCDEETEMTRWVDGSRIEYEGPDGSDPALFNCSLSPTMPTSLLLFTSLCVLEEKAEPTEEVTEAPDNKCGDYERMVEEMNEDTPCFKVFSEPQSWEQAQKKCAADFGSLVSISSEEENTFFWNIAASYNFKGGMHIAHQSPEDSSTWTWIDGEISITSNTYNNFIKSFPISGSGKCASMATETVAAVWVNVDCEEVKQPFVCQRGDFSVIPSSCPNSAPKSGEEIYSPSYPNSGIACEYFLTVSENKLVEVEIISMISEKNNDYLEILEGTAGVNVVANITGTLLKPAKFTTTKSNVLRVNWKPSGTAEGRGFKIRYTEVGKVDGGDATTIEHFDTTTKSATSYGIHSFALTVLAFLRL